MITNYPTLQTAIATWLHRSDLTAVIPDFIALAESRINRLLTARGTEIDTSLVATVGSAYIDLPTDFGAPIALWQGDKKLILKTSVDLSFADIAGSPNYWAIKGSQIQLDRLASESFALTLRYVQNLNLATTDTNYVLSNYPDIYLYGALLESAGFIRDDSRIPIWQQKFEQALAEAQSNENSVKKVALITEPANSSRFNILEG